ncbi:hypothetical protein DFQ27_009723 [Actinomortierella ambigua]|uniref:Uncharacterized protein n=1 Tax=Actinomortierella ambigua TaxID=1343610 RepID=A0A9P6PM97_9FUNG|nr:hypothetical protein DFQ27_009723 [Actinomortierella ambigua]
MPKLSFSTTTAATMLAALNTVGASSLQKRALSPQAMKNLPGWAIALIVIAPFIITIIVVCIVIAYKQRLVRKRTLKTSQLLGSDEYLAAHQNANLHSNDYTNSAQPAHEMATLSPAAPASAAAAADATVAQTSPDHTVIIVPAPTLPPAYNAADESVSALSRA